MSSFQIPPRVKQGFVIASALDNDKRAKVIELIKASPLGTDPKDLLLLFTENLNSSEDDATELVSMIFSLIGLTENSDSTIEETTQDLIKALEELNDETLKIDSAFQEFLKSILSVSNNDSLNLTKKAYNLIHERDNLITDSKIITDLRPVFGGSDNDEIKACSILFNLRISFQKKSKLDKETSVVFALDEKDLKNLKEQINRAEQKAKTIESSFSEIIFIQTK
jgi:uncharacterized protein (UPF0335 family)